MVDFSRPYDEQSVTGVPINPASNNPIKVDQTSYVQTLGNDAVDDDGFDISANLHGSEVAETVNIAIVIDNSGSTADDSGTDFDGDGSTDSILEGELYAAMRLFDAYISAGYDPSEINISLTTYNATSTQWGTFDLTERDDFIAALEDIGDRGPGGATNFVAGLNSVDTAWSGSGADPSDTNIVVFMSDGEPWPPGVPQDIEGARDALVGDWGADIAGIGIGANSSLGDLNRLDTTPDGADQVLSGEELLDIIVEPLADAEFLRFEIEVEGVDANGDPMTQTLIIDETTVDANGDPVLVTTQLGWSFNCVPLDPAFDPTQDITVTFNGIFAEDPGNPGSGEQVVSTEHLLHLVICFTAGTNILTPNGPVAIEHLAGGDRVVTRDHGVQRIRWIGASEISAGRMQMRADLRRCPGRRSARCRHARVAPAPGSGARLALGTDVRAGRRRSGRGLHTVQRRRDPRGAARHVRHLLSHGLRPSRDRLCQRGGNRELQPRRTHGFGDGRGRAPGIAGAVSRTGDGGRLCLWLGPGAAAQARRQPAGASQELRYFVNDYPGRACAGSCGVVSNAAGPAPAALSFAATFGPCPAQACGPARENMDGAGKT